MTTSLKITSYVAPSTQTGAFTFALGQEVSGVVFNSGGAAIATVPTDSAVDFPSGINFPIAGTGAGQLTFTPASGVTLISPENKRKLRVTGSAATLWKIAPNTWLLTGDLTT